MIKIQEMILKKPKQTTEIKTRDQVLSNTLNFLIHFDSLLRPVNPQYERQTHTHILKFSYTWLEL